MKELLMDKCDMCGGFDENSTWPLWVDGASKELCWDCVDKTPYGYVCGICGGGPATKWDGLHHLCKNCTSHRNVRMNRIRPCHLPECGKPAFEFDDSRSWDQEVAPECNCCADTLSMARMMDGKVCHVCKAPAYCFLDEELCLCEEHAKEEE